MAHAALDWQFVARLEIAPARSRACSVVANAAPAARETIEA